MHGIARLPLSPPWAFVTVRQRITLGPLPGPRQEAAIATDGVMLGSTLNRRFRLEQRLGGPPASPHYLATDASNGEMLTVRLLPRHVSLRGEAGLRYRRALARLKGLHHPNLLIPVEAATANGVAFLASPYYPSTALTEAVAQQALTVPEIALVLQQTAEALEVLHRAGVVHGGVNLDAILIAREDGLQAVLAHPALALLVPPEEVSAAAACFKAPEEIPALEGAPDGRADLYALGVVAWR